MSTLALVGSGEYLPPMQPVDRVLLARVGTTPRVVCLPTAAGRDGPDRVADRARLGVAHFRQLGVAVETLPLLTRADAHDPALVEAIARANFIYLSGGRPAYLQATLAGTPAWAAVQRVLDDGGLLAGCSAGAMIQGARFPGFPRWRAGFGLLPGVTVLPHYDEVPSAVARLVRMLAPRDLALVGVDGDTALVVDGNRADVVGNGAVTIWRGTMRTRVGAGPLPADLLASIAPHAAGANMSVLDDALAKREGP